MKYYLLISTLLVLFACRDSDRQNLSEFDSIVNSLPDSPTYCETDTESINQLALLNSRCNWLSNFNLFTNLSSGHISPNEKGFSYELNSELFTDYAKKSRFIFLPSEQTIEYSDTGSFIFPIGSVIVKTFSFEQGNSNYLKEIRLSIKRSGGWIYIPYIWDEKRNDAFFYREGVKVISIADIGTTTKEFLYETPSASNCLECHRNEYAEETISFKPIGPKARHLNKSINVNGRIVNQLTYWSEKGRITKLPSNLYQIDTAPNWRDETAPLQDRAKAYLDINCAHCHSEGGTGALSGLRLEYWRKSTGHSHGVCNSSHGWRGGGFDIWPGQGEISSIPIRMRHTEAKDRMPPIGRSLVDEEAAQLVSDWIDTLPYEECAN